MKNIEVNKLELKLYYNPELPEGKVDKDDGMPSFRGRNFIEYYIDGKGLMSEINRVYTKDGLGNIFEGYVGLLASFTEFTDIVVVPMLLKMEYENEVRAFVEKYASFHVTNEKFKELFEDFIELTDCNTTLLYICSCGDIGCGGLGVMVQKDKQYYYWIFGDSKTDLVYKFEKDQYESELIKYLVSKYSNDLNKI